MKTAHETITLSAKKYGRRDAVILDNDRLSYQELHEESNRIAHQLLSLGIEKGCRIGIYLDKSLQAIAAVLGILKAGGAYVPLDCNSPIEKNRYIADDCGIETIITIPDKMKQVEEMGRPQGSLKTMVLLSQGASQRVSAMKVIPYSEVLARAASDVGGNSASEDLAAILYTSGSTGTPKGVMLTHGNIVSFTVWAVNTFAITENDRLLSHAPLHFDLSLLDIYSALARGACIVLVPYQKSMNPQYLLNLVSEKKITVWQSVPSVLILLSEIAERAQGVPNTVKHVLFAGERLPLKYLKKLSDCFEGAEFYNIYGCTETNDTFLYHVPKDTAGDPLPIGKPLSYVKYIIRESTEPCELSRAEGELLVSAPTVMKGYWGGETKNAECFEDIISEEGVPTRYFRTKDIVRPLPDGNFHLCGRTDNIIKSNGYRINLLEIERLLLGHPAIREAGVVAIPDDFVGNKICACVFIDSETTASVVDLKIFCSSRMQKYMIPHLFAITRQELSKTSSGKIDKQALVRQFKTPRLNADYSSASNI